MKKNSELVGWRRTFQGAYVASVYNREGGYSYDLHFMDYSRKEVLKLLRNKYGVIVPNEKAYERVGRW